MALKIIGGVKRDGAAAHFQRAMMMDVGQAAKAVNDAEIEAAHLA